MRSAVCYIAFTHYNKMSETMNLQRERVILAHGLGGFSTFLGDPILDLS
jgi:hypothetical protein